MAKATAQTINPCKMIYPTDQIDFKTEDFPADEIFAKNIRSLEQSNPKLADMLAKTQLPEYYKLDICTDGAFCYRITNTENNSSFWLGKRSAAALAAESDITRLNLAQSNAAVNGFGDGYTIAQAIRSFMPFQAIFVIEKDINIIKANLNIHDFSRPLASGQLVIIHSEEPFTTLTDFLAENTGYQMIEKTVYIYRLSEQENNQFNLHITAAVEKALNITADISHTFAEKLEKLQPKNIADTKVDMLTIANLPCGSNPDDSIITRDFLDGFANSGFKTHYNSFSSPKLATTLAQTSEILTQKPDALLLVNSLRKMIKYPIPQSFPVISILPNLTEELARELTENSTGDKDIIVCPKKCLGKFSHAKLNSQCMELEYYVNQNIYQKISDECFDREIMTLPVAKSNPVIMLCGRNPLDLEKYNVRLSSHQNLINSACETIADNPASYNSSLAQVYFEKAAKKTATKISDQETRDSLLQIFRQLADSITQDIYGYAMLKQEIKLSVFQLRKYLKNSIHIITETPNEWLDSPLEHLLVAEVTDSPELNLVFNSAKIAVFTHNDGTITQQMLNAAAAGVLIMTKAHPKDNRSDGINNIFETGKEIITYTTEPDLCRKVRLYLENESKRMEIAQNAINKINSRFQTKFLCQKIINLC